jgi:hypothetical protein
MNNWIHNLVIREALIEYLANIRFWLGDQRVGPIVGSAPATLHRLDSVDPFRYGCARNCMGGAATEWWLEDRFPMKETLFEAIS